MSVNRENSNDFIGEGQASDPLLAFDSDVDDLDADDALLSSISCWLGETSPTKGSPGGLCMTGPSSNAATVIPDGSVNSAPRRRRRRCRRNCAVAGCGNRVVQGGVCVTHGAKRKPCMEEGCDKAVKKAGFCSAHGPARKKCEFPGCCRVAVQGGVCIGHGAKQSICSIETCRRKFAQDGLCKSHAELGVSSKAIPPAIPPLALVEGQPTLMTVSGLTTTTNSSTVASTRPVIDFGKNAMCFECPTPEVAAAVAQAPPAPSQAFQQLMYERGLSIFEEMGEVWQPLLPTQGQSLPSSFSSAKRPRLNSNDSPSGSNDLERFYSTLGNFGMFPTLDKIDL